jgi:hypothetical protein
MALNSSRLLIGQGLVALVQSVMNGPNPLYGLVKLGSVFDPTPYTSFVEITFATGKSKPAGSGGQQIGWRIEDDPLWCVASGWDYEADSTAATVNMLTAMDILIPFLHTHYQIPNPNNPSIAIASLYHLTEWDRDERARPVRFPNGRIYLMWEIYLGTKQQYNVTIVNP